MTGTGSFGDGDIDKIALLKILFKKLLGDGKIDAAEKTLFARFKHEFGIGDAKYSQVLAETVAEIKAEGNIFTGGENLDENGREYKISIYREAYYRMLLNGRISAGENELLITLNEILELAEDAEQEAVTAAHKSIITEAEKNIEASNFGAAEKLLLSFTPDKKLYGEYYRAAYLLCKGRSSEYTLAEGQATGPEARFEELFMRREGAPAVPACWEALYYRGRLTPASPNDDRREKFLNEALDAALEDRQKHLVYFQLAFGRQTVGDFEKAIEYYAQAEKYGADDPDIAVNVLSCMLSLKRYEPAKKYADERLEKFRSCAAFVNNCGIASLKTGDRQQAVNLFKKALAADPGFNDARINLSRLM